MQNLSKRVLVTATTQSGRVLPNPCVLVDSSRSGGRCRSGPFCGREEKGQCRSARPDAGRRPGAARGLCARWAGTNPAPTQSPAPEVFAQRPEPDSKLGSHPVKLERSVSKGGCAQRSLN